MPYQKTGTEIARPDLGMIAFETIMEAEKSGFIANELMPIREVQNKKGSYPKMEIENMFKPPGSLKRAPRGKYKRDDWEFDRGTYECADEGFEAPLDDEEREMYKNDFDAEVIASNRATFKLLLGDEIIVADMLLNTTNITTNQAAAAAWSTAASATPRVDVMALKKKMRNNRGILPNAMAIAKSLFDELFLTSEIKDAFKYTNPIEIGGFEAQKRIMAQYFGLDKIQVGNAIKDTAKPGKTASLTDVWDSTLCGLFRVAISEDMQEPAIGRTMLWTGDSPQSLIAEEYRENESRCWIHRSRHNTDKVFVFTGAGGLITGV